MEDEYEYACMKTQKPSGAPSVTGLLFWEDKKSAEADVKMLGASSKFYTYKLVRRRKAGPVEEVPMEEG